MTIWLIAVSAACSNKVGRINKGQVIDAAWNAQKPYTYSGNISNWDIKNIKIEKGTDAADLFKGEAVQPEKRWGVDNAQ